MIGSGLSPCRTSGATRPANASLPAVAFAAFGIGTTEFVIMGLLPEVAGNLRAGLPVAVLIGVALVLLVFVVLGRTPRVATVIATLWGVFAFAVCAITQAMAVEAASRAPNLASTLNISALNLGNALEAGLGLGDGDGSDPGRDGRKRSPPTRRPGSANDRPIAWM